MEYQELAQARIDDYRREWRQIRLTNEVRRLHRAGGNGMGARLDGLLVRIGNGAKQRQARRGATSATREAAL